jgi:hypothetical protein
MTLQGSSRSALSAVVAAVLFAGHATSGSAQSLADVARREAERRQQVPSGKVYTDGDLAPVDAATPSPQAPAPQSAASGAETTTDPQPSASEAPPGNNPGKEPVMVKAREKRDEQYWRKLVRDLTARIGKANADVAAQEARLAEIDGGEQTPTRLSEREAVTESLNRSQRDARSLSEQLTRFRTRAQIEKVPAEWIQ